MARLARLVAPGLPHRIGQRGIDRSRRRPLGRRPRRSTTYAALSGKVATVAYPSGLTLAYSYNAYGYQSQIKDNSSGQVYWTANARDQFLHLINETAGNGVVRTRTFSAQTGWVGTIQAGTSAAVANFSYTFDLVGNLTQRVDGDLSRTDGFTYDALNRLATYSIAGGAAQTMGYDALGDITSKPGIGTYNYPAAGQARPHGVSSITGTVRGVVNPSFTYDADGNTLSGPAMSATYTSYDMASTISTGPQGPGPYWGSFNWGQANWRQAGGSSVSLSYNSEHQRMEMVATTASTFYFNDPTSGAVAELYTPTSGPAQWRDYVMADGRMIAERTAVTGGATTWQYFVADHLGSIAVTTDGSGSVSERMLYDPWGLQLSTSGAPLCGVGTPTTRGFTGEEQMPLDCLVNLNARVYDPVLGRFMTGDPVISSVYDQQALNRYSYVHNNPLSLTDVNGECPICLFIIDVIADLIFAEVLKPVFERVPILGDLWIIADSLYCGPLCAAEDAGLLAGVETGKVGKALEAFALTYAEAYAFNKVGDDLEGLKAVNQAGMISDFDYNATAFIEHGLVGGIFSAIRGQGFGSGFLAAGVSELATPYIEDPSTGDVVLGTAESAVIGGTSSVLGGGKFGNGAVTGAFGYLFNAAQHQGKLAQVTQNRDCHQCAVAQEALKYEEQGYIVTSNVSFIDPATGLKVVVDLVVSDPSFPLPTPELLIDVKTGDGGLTPNQSIVYPKLEAGTIATPVGLNALTAGFIPGIPTQIQMKVDIPRYPGVKSSGN